MRGHNICFLSEIRKIIFVLSSVLSLIWNSELHVYMHSVTQILLSHSKSRPYDCVASFLTIICQYLIVIELLRKLAKTIGTLRGMQLLSFHFCHPCY